MINYLKNMQRLSCCQRCNTTNLKSHLKQNHYPFVCECTPLWQPLVSERSAFSYVALQRADQTMRKHVDSMRNVGDIVAWVTYKMSGSEKPETQHNCATMPIVRVSFMAMVKTLYLQYIILSPKQIPEIVLQLSRRSAANSTYKHTHSDSCTVP